jgi:general secretion pathway protein K
MNCAESFRKCRHFLAARIDRQGERASEAGWALISVLYVVAMLALLAAATEALLLTSAELDRRAWERTEADALLNAAVTRAVLGITDKRIDRRWRVDSAEETFTLDDHPVQVRIQDQLGLIDLNAADGSMIKRLLQACGVDEDAAAQLTDRILDWRSTTSLERLKSSSGDANQTGRYRPRHGAFQSVAELRLVSGMTPDLFRQMEPAITIYNGHPAFEPSTAPEMALRALYLDRPDEVARVLANRNTENGGSRAGILSPSITLAGRSFAITVSIQLNHRTYHRQTVIMLTEDSRRPFLTLAWN